MKKTYEKPMMQTEVYDAEDVITASSLEQRNNLWSTQQVSSGTLTNMGIQIN